MQGQDIVVQDREELFQLLAEAAEFEHAVMCAYLYAMWTLKRDTDEGVTADELAAIDGWRRSLRQVALEEMLHLSLVNNLLAATGAAPHLWRPAFPIPPGRFPSNVVMRLSPFSAATMDHFLYLERPEGIELVDGAGFDHPDHHPRASRSDLLSPTPRDYASQGQLYHSILRGLADLARDLGEDDVFVGHGEAQVTSGEFGLPGLFRIDGLDAARRAVEEIVLQGEGAPAHRDGSHYRRFVDIKAELERLQAARPDFQPARAVVENPSLTDPEDAPDTTPISHPGSAKLVDLGDALYALMMRTFAQVFAPAPLPKALRAGLAGEATEIMRLMSEVGEAVTRLPAAASGAGAGAGLTFALSLSSGQLVQRCAAQILGERARELANAAGKLEAAGAPITNLGPRLTAVADRLSALHERYEEHLELAVQAVAAAGPPPALPPAPAAGDDPNVAETDALTLRFDTRRCIHSRRCVLGAPSVFLANVQGPWLHPETVSTEACVAIAHACPSGAITYERRDGGPPEAAPPVNVLHLRENGPYVIHAAIDLQGYGPVHRATLCRCGRSANKPFCDNSHIAAGFAATGEPQTQPSDPLAVRGGPLAITPVIDGPLQVIGPLELCAGGGRTIARTEAARLCRCGGSATKPFCDGTHATIGFKSEPPAPTPSSRRPIA